MNTLWISRACFLLLVVAVIGFGFFYTQHRELAAAHRALEQDVRFRVGRLERQMHERRLGARVAHLRISTTDHPQISASDLRIPFGSTNTHEFTHLLFKFGRTVEQSLLSDWRPRDEITKFEEFRIRPGTNDMLWIEVRLKPEASVNMSFSALALGR